MAWNQPGNKERDNDRTNNGQQENDPWGQKRPKKTNRSTDDLSNGIRRFFRKIKKNKKDKLPVNFFIIFLIFIVIAVISWGVIGFYTIDPNKKGVITRFGQVQNEIVESGNHWRPFLIDDLYIVDTLEIHNIDVTNYSIVVNNGIVVGDYNFQYQIQDPIKYLFGYSHLDSYLNQIAENVLNEESEKFNLDILLSDKGSALETIVKEKLTNVISKNDTGITLTDIHISNIRIPDKVKNQFKDVNKAQEKNNEMINQAELNKDKLLVKAHSDAAKIVENANRYKHQLETNVKNEVIRLNQLLPQYKMFPDNIRKHLYRQTQKHILSNMNEMIMNKHVDGLNAIESETSNQNNSLNLRESEINTQTLVEKNKSVNDDLSQELCRSSSIRKLRQCYDNFINQRVRD